MLSRDRFKQLRNGFLCGATAWAVRLLYLTVRFDVHGWERAKTEVWDGAGAIYVFWHNSLMLPLGHECRKGFRALISPGKDGEYAARVVRHFGIGSLRGSTSKDGARVLLRALKEREGPVRIAVTPDGPRGPRYVFQIGSAWLASRLQAPVIPIGIAMTRAWKLRSWDRYRIPKPFCRAVFVFGEPVHTPPGLDREGLEAARVDLEKQLHRVSREAAERAGCTWPD